MSKLQALLTTAAQQMRAGQGWHDVDVESAAALANSAWTFYAASEGTDEDDVRGFAAEIVKAGNLPNELYEHFRILTGYNFTEMSLLAQPPGLRG